MLWEKRLGMLLLVPISVLIMCRLMVAEEVEKPGLVPLFQAIETSKSGDSSSDVTYGRIILGRSRKTKDGGYIAQNGEDLPGNTPDVAEYDYQSDFDWHHLEKLQEEASGSFSPRSPAVETLLQEMPMVECGAEIMTLRVKGDSLLYLLVDRGEDSPLPLSKLPPQCGYSLRSTWRDTAFLAPYDGCYGVKEGDEYVLPLRWGGTPLKMTCPARTRVAASPSVSCHPSGMVVTIPGSADASKLKIMHKGTWKSLLWVSVQCGYSVVTHSGGLVVTAPFATCGEIKDGMYTMEFMDRRVKVSCPSQPLTGSHSVPPSPTTNVSRPQFAVMTLNPNESYFTPLPKTVTRPYASVTFGLQRPLPWYLMVHRPHLPTHAPVKPEPVTRHVAHTVHKPLPTKSSFLVPAAPKKPALPSHKHPTPPAQPHIPHLWNPNNPLIPVYSPTFPLPTKPAPRTPAPHIPKLAPPFPGLPPPAPHIPKLAPPFPGLPSPAPHIPKLAPPFPGLPPPAPHIPKLAPPFPGLPSPAPHIPKLAPPFPGLTPPAPYRTVPWHFNLFETPVPFHPHFYPSPPKPTPEIPSFLRPPPQVTSRPLTDPLYTPIPKPVVHHPFHVFPHLHHADLFYPSLAKPPVLPPMVPQPVGPVGPVLPVVPCVYPPCPWHPMSSTVFHHHNHMHSNLGSRFPDCAQTHPGKPSTSPDMLYHRHHNPQDSSVSQRGHQGPASQPLSHFWDLVVPFSKPLSHMGTEHRGSPPQSYYPSFYWNPAHQKPPELTEQSSYSQDSEPVLDEHAGSHSAATSLSVSFGSR
ncbi:uncharacterized protein LOC125716328 isoform X3 [Brienomyrus brachyistius]|uniref:uncharacterized protein LOC125716328 isoform X3 n=1 Tax=Brienomyrus brachyistius TaxID=42636 RepID=UPI0020B2EEF1|nr:uncharacterized protein LOC125716328 isoform X3 [Brienomyrus brachyistius]